MSDQEKEIASLPSSESNEITHQLHILFSQIFSKEYLDSDPFLQSQVGLPLSLPTTAIYQSPIVLSITTDTELIRQAMESSNSLIVIENIVRPNVKAEQHTIILRDVEESITEDIIKEIFEKTSCPPIASCRSEMNNTWFVTFSSESDARLALDKIKNVSLAGKPVRARLKTESFVRTYPRSQSGGDNSSPTFRPPQLVIDEHSTPSESSSHSQQTISAQSPQYYYPPMFPIPPHLMNPNGQSPGSGTNTPQFPNIPGVYYMYPPFPNGFIPHPMHHPVGPMGSPMYMGGVWMPPYPMMPMPPNSNSSGTPTQQTSGRGKHRQKSSPRSGQPYSPSRNSQNKTFNPKDRQQGTNLPVEVPTSQVDEKQEFDGSQEETKDQFENNGNKKKYLKKRRERSQEVGQGITEDLKSNGLTDNTTKDDRKNKESQYQGGNYKQYNNNGNPNGSRVKGRDREKTKQGNQTQAKAIPPKVENKFNLEADFPTLHNAPTLASRPTLQQTSGISWAERISKTAIQPEPVNQSVSSVIVDKSAPPIEDELSANLNEFDHHDHLVNQIKFIPSQPLDELNISFGNVNMSSSTQTSDLILPENHHHSNNLHSTPVENKPQSFNLSGAGKFEEKPTTLANIQGNLEYVPISFGAFEATIPLTSENLVNSSDTSHITSGGKLTFLDIVRKGKL